MSKNPFQYTLTSGHQVESTDAQSRIERVKTFDILQCSCALEVPGLQKTVAAAIRRRMKQLERGAA